MPDPKDLWLPSTDAKVDYEVDGMGMTVVVLRGILDGYTLKMGIYTAIKLQDQIADAVRISQGEDR